jgi:U3 small nucleolar RNA-associated protein 22
VEVLNRALGDRITAVRAFTSGNGDVRKDTSPSSQSMENISTKAIADSDQFVAVPIRGGSSSATSAAICGFAAKLRERPPEPPVRLNQDDPCLVVGLRIDPDASRRIVDRGPPAENVEGSSAFTTLWGDHAQLRRFQDGAIVRAVVWNLSTFSRNSVVEAMPQFAGMDRSMGGIVEKVVQRIIELHFTDSAFMKAGKAKQVSFELRNMVGFVDGVLSSPEPSPVSDSFTLHKNVMSAFDSLAAFLRENSISAVDNSSGKERTVSRLGLPLKIEEVEPLSPVLRYSSLFPPLPHPLLGGIDLGIDKRKVSGAVVGSPVLIQIRFQGSSRWPSSLNAMGAAKCAMLIRLAEGIEKMKQSENLDEFDGPIDVTPTYLDIGYRGYSWRIIVRADEELRMLKNLRNPTAEAKSLRLSLINRHVRGSMHHSLIHAIHTKHPSSSLVSRLAHRWVASHMLSGMIPLEAIELIVAKIYTDPYEKVTPKMRIGTPPTTTTAGLLRFLQTIYTHDWATEPMIVDPQSHITARDRESILAQFHRIRGPDLKGGPAMYIISPTDYDGVEEMTGSMVVGGEGASEQVAGRIGDLGRVWSPTYTSKFPERVVLSRAAALARCSHDHLTSCLMNGSSGSGWVAAFQESSASLTSYSALLRVDSIFVTDTGCCSTNADSVVGAASKQDSNIKVASPFERSLLKRYSGPKDFRSKIYKNLVLEKGTLVSSRMIFRLEFHESSYSSSCTHFDVSFQHEWHPVKSLVSKLRSNYSEYAIFFYNEFAPDIIAMIWRPAAFAPKPFSVMISEFQSPVLKFWKDDSLVITNAEELISEIGYVGRNILSDIKLLDYRKPDRLTHQSAI